MAERLATLKSDHMPAAPVRFTCTPPVESFLRAPLRLSAAATIRLGSRAAPACTIAVWPSGEIDRPGVGATTVRTAPFERRACSTRAMTDLNSGLVAVWAGEYRTVIRP